MTRKGRRDSPARLLAPDHPPMALSFREMTPGDIEGMFSVRARTRQNPASRQQLEAWGITPASTAASMAGGKLACWGCFHDATLVGFCSGDVTTGEVLVLAVLPEHEGFGIGRRLLAHVVDGLRCAGFPKPWLAASSDPRIRAHGFYRRLGWKPTGRSLENGDEILELNIPCEIDRAPTGKPRAD